MRAAIYCRISKDRTGEEAGVTRQLEDCRAKAEELGWPVVEIYTDNDISATSGKVRPRYQALLAAIKAREIDAIVVWHPDRLYRKLTDLEALIEVVEGNNILVKPVQTGEIDLSTASGRGIARILGVVATMEGEQKSERWRRSIRQRRERGQAPGWGPRLFGYTRDGQIITAEAEAIRWAFDALISGESIRNVARELNARGLPTSKGNEWTTQAVTGLIRNPRLAGHSTLNGETLGVGNWEPIIDNEMFEQVQAVFSARRGSAPPAPRVSLLIGLARCGLCGSPLITGRQPKRKGERQGRRVYRCRPQPGTGACGRIAIDALGLEELVEAYAKVRAADPMVREAQASLTAAGGDHTAEIIALEERLGELEAQLLEPGLAVSAISRAIDKTHERIAELRARVGISPVPLPREDHWPESLAVRARLIRQVVESVTVAPVTKVGRNTFESERVSIVPR